MTLPSWQDEKLGTMRRAALWLLTVVGEGEVFTKEQIKNAFPGKSQADRRVRELRVYGWKIDTHREDARLGQHEQRFVAQGQPVWESGKTTKGTSALTDTQRRRVLTRDGNRCRSCGITPGQQYADTFETAQIDIARRKVKLPNGTSTVQPVAECNRCRVGGRSLEADLSVVLEDVSKLGGSTCRRSRAGSPLTSASSASWNASGPTSVRCRMDSRDEVRKVLGLPPA